MGTFVGIDLGTTNSVVARRDPYGRPEVIPNRDGHALTPSVIYFGADPPVIGQEAKEWARLGDDEIASVFKPHMGNPFYRLRLHGRDYSATELSALVLRGLKADAEAKLGEEVDRAVVAVPAYFADPQRKATMEACRLAGLRVTRLISEPTAAALAYGLTRSGAEETVLVYDLGGGTFDVTVARVGDAELTVLATAGDHDLGGKNWDDRIATYLAEKFHADTGIDPLDQPLALNEVLVRSEQAKCALSERSSTRVTLQVDGERQSYELTRAEFEGMTFPLMERTRRLTQEALESAGLAWPKIDGVLLVGGSTRMPMVREFVTKMSGRSPKAGVNVDEAVALGAAARAGMDEDAAASPRFTLPSRRVRDVMAHSLGTVALNPEGTAYVNDVVIRRNLPIPAEDTRPYLHETHGGRNNRLEIYLTQGESAQPLDCSVLGKYVVSGIEPTEAQVTIDVTISYDENGVVQVSATQRDTGARLALAVEPVPDDLSWMGRPPETTAAGLEETPKAVYLLIDVSVSMAGHPLLEAQSAARAFVERCDFANTLVGLIAFSDRATLLTEATDLSRSLQSGISALQVDGSTNLGDALAMARDLLARHDRSRFVVILTDGYPDAPEDAAWQAAEARAEGIQVVAIGIGSADRDYLRTLSDSDAGAIFARPGDLVKTFGHIAKVIAGGGRGLRIHS